MKFCIEVLFIATNRIVKTNIGKKKSARSMQEVCKVCTKYAQTCRLEIKKN